MKLLRATIETLLHGLPDELFKTTPTKGIKSKKFGINFRKGRNLLFYISELTSHVIIQYFFASLCFALTFALVFLSATIWHIHK